MKCSRDFHLLVVTIVLALVCVADGLAQNAPASTGTDEQPARTVAEDAAVLENGRLSAKRKALARLAAHADSEADKVLLTQLERQRDGLLAPALWLDVFEAAAQRADPAVKARLARREESLAKSKDVLSRFRECLEGGDSEAGRLVFARKPEAGCVRCHSVGGEGGKIGPDLTWLRNAMDRTLILESIISPNSVIAPGFGSVSLTLKDGENLSGVVAHESRDEITITSVVDAKRRTVKLNDIAERAALPSPMPPHFGMVLTKREIRDLVEFIAVGD